MRVLGSAPYLADDPRCILYLRSQGGPGNTKFYDASPSHKTITRYGDTQNTGTSAIFPPASILFDGTGDYLQMSDYADFNIGTEDFTVSMWVNPIYVTTNYYGILLCEGTTENYLITLYNNAGTIGFRYYDLTVGTKAASQTISTGVKTHLAATRASGNLQLYVNGVSGFSGAMGTSIDWNALNIGHDPTYPTFDYAGRLDELLIMRGVAVPIERLYPQNRRFIV